jgi:hypothetical protein
MSSRGCRRTSDRCSPPLKCGSAWRGSRPSQVGSTPAEFEAFIRAEALRWGKVIRERNIRTE